MHPGIKIGLVIPIYQTRFVRKVVEKVFSTNPRQDMAILVVNDGRPEVADFLRGQDFPPQVHVLNLPTNLCFAGANNAGWRFLLDNFQDIEYLGTLNDDTVPRRGWLDPLVEALEIYPRTALAAPVMETGEGWLRTRRKYSVWHLQAHPDFRMVLKRGAISEDFFSPVVSGFCFLARRDALHEVGYFDDRYRNSCEDVDLSLKMTTHGWRLLVCHRSCVFHYGGASRYLDSANSDLSISKDLLLSKWGPNIDRYNNLDQQGYLVK